MEKETNNNGYPFVDLSLPSGTLWATMNVGADKPSDCGLYFQWGDTKGYTKKQIGKDKQFDLGNYIWGTKGTNGFFSKYTSSSAVLDLKDDVANAHMGGDWHMPTPTQIKELIENTTSTRKTQNWVNGRLFISKKDASKSIFIPAVGYAWDNLVSSSGRNGFIWPSMLSSKYADAVQSFFFSSEDAYLSIGIRCDGFPVRGVIG